MGSRLGDDHEEESVGAIASEIKARKEVGEGGDAGRFGALDGAAGAREAAETTAREAVEESGGAGRFRTLPRSGRDT